MFLSRAFSGSLWVSLTCSTPAALQHLIFLWRLVMLFILVLLFILVMEGTAHYHDHEIPIFLHLIVGHCSIQDSITRYVITPVRECIYN